MYTYTVVMSSNYRKGITMLEHIGGALLLLGVLLISGALGYDDYIVAMGFAYPLKHTMLKIGVGVAVCCLGMWFLWINNDTGEE